MLNTITTGKIRRPPIVGLSGVPGVGKSSWAAKAPKPIFICTEDGTAELDVARFPLMKSWEDVLTALKALGTEEHDYKTVVIDSLDALELLIWDYVCRQNGVKSIELAAGGYGKGFGSALNEFRVLFDQLNKLRDRKGMGAVLISHVRIRHHDDPTSDGYDRYVPKLHQSKSYDTVGFVVESCDAWGFANWDIAAIADTTDDTRKRGVSQGTRHVYWEERPAFIAKNRYNLPAKMPLDWDAFRAAMNPEPPKGN